MTTISDIGINVCDSGHQFTFLHNHPERNGRLCCPYCMATELDNKQFFNKLSPAEVERLAILVEECGEVIQVVGKTLRHGWNPIDHNTGIQYDNRADLEKEIADTRVVTKMMFDNNDIDPTHLVTRVIDKERSIQKHLHHHYKGRENKNDT
jgi:NTP pyrophosphatase (non-canonical NTP hydrolase)